MLSFLRNKDNSEKKVTRLEFEHPQRAEDLAGFLALNTPVFIYKHSTRCSVSLFAMKRLNSVLPQPAEKWLYIDVIAQRDLSLALADQLDVVHQSPQLILWHNKVLDSASHNLVNEDTVAGWRNVYINAEQV